MPTLISIGSFSISSFGFFCAVTYLIGAFLIWRVFRDKGIEDEKFFDNFLVVSIISFLGARLFFVLTHWSIFSGFPLGALFIGKNPGFSLWGLLATAALTLIWYCRKQRLETGVIADAYAQALPVMMIFWSLALFLDGTIIGKETSWPTGIIQTGLAGLRHPVGMYALILSLVMSLSLFFVLRFFGRRNLPCGTITLTILSFLGVSQLLLAFFRDDLLYWQGFPVDLMIATVVWISPLPPLYLLLNGGKLVTQVKQKVTALVSRPKL
ncbi:MAG: Prolipoprotein diacylglyceryl transferase [Candidatus Gottesmanbacteria bacterium GW2011_GWA1_43_11]|uniref:Prolipoprotein diacylglyceryl transferase n=1 Tax=Candidatus Gottesmanbacteria bacterium GW2011_GWA1_43_11 TaxID=1618436 RepID=A0A0G1CIL8_9BACT|nr:MAG: Prolipoprotein diacylglyceryl transferase [Candidatus Gottesmanbacteria bacterium GW2011_GWA1_43_11]